MSNFYDHKAGCRKTCWQTPQHVANDIPLIKECAALIEAGDGEKLFTFLNQGKGEDNKGFVFFNRVIGWPEGLDCFMRGTPQGRTFYMGGLKEHYLPRIQTFLTSVMGPKQA
jgi:hypothetical protein